MSGATRIVSGAVLSVVAVVVAAFVVFFLQLVLRAFSLSTGLGQMPYMFTSYGYISIELTFLAVILFATYQILKIGLHSKPDDDLTLG